MKTLNFRIIDDDLFRGKFSSNEYGGLVQLKAE